MPPDHRIVDAASRAVRFEYLLVPFLVFVPLVVAASLVLVTVATHDVRAAAYGLILLLGTGVVNARMVQAFLRERRGA